MLRVDSVVPLVTAVLNNCLLEYIFLLLQAQRITEANSLGSASWTLCVPRSVAVRGQWWTAPTRNSPGCPPTCLSTPLTCECAPGSALQLHLLVFLILNGCKSDSDVKCTSYFYPCVRMGKQIVFHFLSTSPVSSSNAGQAQAVSLLSSLPWSPLPLHHLRNGFNHLSESVIGSSLHLSIACYLIGAGLIKLM